jgi:hypothetical protein
MKRTVPVVVAFLVAVSCAKRGLRKETAVAEHAVIVHFDYGSTDLAPIFKLGHELERAIDAAHAGEYDGNEVAVDGSDGYLYMYGPDADVLFRTVRPALESVGFMQGARVTLRYGPPEDGVRESRLVLGTQPSDRSGRGGAE